MTASSRPLMWAEGIAARSLALQEQGVPGEQAWCLAAGVPRSRRAEHSWERAAAWVAAQARPVTSVEVGEALELPETAAAGILRQAERRGLVALAGTTVVGRAKRILWRAP